MNNQPIMASKNVVDLLHSGFRKYLSHPSDFRTPFRRNDMTCISLLASVERHLLLIEVV